MKIQKLYCGPIVLVIADDVLANKPDSYWSVTVQVGCYNK